MNKLEIQEIILKIVHKISLDYHPEKIILFGSYAQGNSRPDSDIDLFIIKDTKQRRVDRFVEVKRIVYDSKRKYVVSPLVYTPKEIEERVSMGDDFIREILETGRVLYHAG
jgi:predicted nucleotidyltransferase